MSDRRNDATAVTGTPSPSPTNDDELAAGTIVGEFEIERTLGRGGMGSVYGAIHTVIGKRGAVKVLRHDLCTNQDEVGRFIQEARVVNQIGHANIVDVFAFGSLPDGRSYLVMEWLNGESLGDRLRRGPLTRPQIFDVMCDVVNALEAAHAKGIIHRDLKPDNVFLVETQGDRRRAKLLDFGVAKLTAEGKHGWTRMGALIGTPQYIAPEQARGEAVVHSDIYALGILLFELLAGRPPFEGKNMVEVVSMHMMEPPPRLSTLADVPREIDDLVNTMLAKEGSERPALAAIRAGLGSLVPDRALGVPKQASHTGRNIAIALGLAGAAAVVAFLIVRGTHDDHVAPAVVDAGIAAVTPPAPPPRPPPPPTPPPTPPPIAASGTLVVTVKSPKGLVIEVDGARAKPNQVIELAPGLHKVAVLRNGKQISEQSVDITAGNQTKIEPRGLRVPVPVSAPRPPDIDDSLRVPQR